ncbi:hypothetical protein QBC40DRAFT_258188 [Triangularia verruculosa]|uniref:RNase H type-1 domain-containing protein n=1 Tax=Triangularia verruculosa TaxID=2587418 RepID=A0AAN7ARW2_9PEZI|nr:hypothetical protein QBC40DRAFT_258188 [Triangularia verruculosa]
MSERKEFENTGLKRLNQAGSHQAGDTDGLMSLPVLSLRTPLSSAARNHAQHVMTTCIPGICLGTPFLPLEDVEHSSLFRPRRVRPAGLPAAQKHVERFCFAGSFLHDFNRLRTMAIYTGAVDLGREMTFGFTFGPSEGGSMSFPYQHTGADGRPHRCTRDRAEMQAVLAALGHRDWWAEGWERVVIITNSEYLGKGVTQNMIKWVAEGWPSRSGGGTNRDLWELLSSVLGEYAKTGSFIFSFTSVYSGHLNPDTSSVEMQSSTNIDPYDHLGPDPEYQDATEAHRWDSYFSPETRLRHINPNLCTVPDCQFAEYAASVMGNGGKNFPTATDFDNCDGSGHIWQATNYGLPPDLLPQQILLQCPVRKHPTREIENRFLVRTNPKHMAVFVDSWPAETLPGCEAVPGFICDYIFNLDSDATGHKRIQITENYRGDNDEGWPLDENRAALSCVIEALLRRPPVRDTCFPTGMVGWPKLPPDRNNMVKWWIDGFTKVIIITSSEYVHTHATQSMLKWGRKGWRRKSSREWVPVANRDL